MTDIQYDNPAVPEPPVPEHLIAQLYALRQTKAAIEKQEKILLADLKPLVDPELDSLPDSDKTAKLMYGDHELARVPGMNRTIKADKLLERGVSPDIVDYATDTVTYYQYRIRIPKQKEDTE